MQLLAFHSTDSELSCCHAVCPQPQSPSAPPSSASVCCLSLSSSCLTVCALALSRRTASLTASCGE